MDERTAPEIAEFFSMLGPLKRKRSVNAKQTEDPQQEPELAQLDGAFEDSDGESEGEGSEGSTSGEESDTEPFPEFDPSSDTEVTDADSDKESDKSFEVKLFPKGEVVISNVTGQPKRNYPEIDPVYDSDSSTEEVR
jgi:ribosome biogenesis protein ERB1